MLVQGLDGQLSAFHDRQAAHALGKRGRELDVLSSGQSDALKIGFLKTLAHHARDDVSIQADRSEAWRCKSPKSVVPA